MLVANSARLQAWLVQGFGAVEIGQKKCKNAKSKVDVLGERMMLVCCYQYFQGWKMCLILDTSKAKLGYFGNWTEKFKCKQQGQFFVGCEPKGISFCSTGYVGLCL